MRGRRVWRLAEGEGAVRADRTGGELVASSRVDPVECVEGDDGVVVVTRRRPLLEVSVDDLHPWIVREASPRDLREPRAELDADDPEPPGGQRQGRLPCAAPDLDHR